jgi:hypothetical protein
LETRCETASGVVARELHGENDLNGCSIVLPGIARSPALLQGKRRRRGSPSLDLAWFAALDNSKNALDKSINAC